MDHGQKGDAAMIAELLDLADRLEIPTPRPFEPMPVHYFIDLDSAGRILGITPAYGRTDEKTGEPELGKEMDCPAYFPLKIKDGTSDEIQAKAGGGISVAEAGHGDVREVFCTEIKTPKGKPPRIEIIEPPTGRHGVATEPGEESDGNDDSSDERQGEDDSDSGTKKGKNQYYRHDGWLEQIKGFIDAESYRDLDVSKALKDFIAAKPRLSDPAILDFFALPDPAKTGANAPTAEESKKAKDAATKGRNAQLKKARFTFRITGQVLLKGREFQQWWQKAYADERDKMLKILPEGSDGFSSQGDDGSKCLTPVFPHIPRVPGGGTYCPLASFDKAATRSFGMGKHTLSMSLTTAERVAAALKWLLKDEHSHCRLGEKLIAVFWAVPANKTVKPCPHDFAALFNEPDALQVLDFFHNIHGHSASVPDSAQFYCAILSSPKSRITVRSWHTETLGRVAECAKAYFKAVSLPDVFRRGQKTTSPLGELADAIMPLKSKSGPPSAAYSTLLRTALFATRLPSSFLLSALTRQSLELAKGCSEGDKGEFKTRLRARTALIKLYFETNKDITMNETTHESQDHPAYLCGRVLALLDRIHNEAHKKSTASSPADRYYGSASSTPALVFPRLCKLARIHLADVRKDSKRGWLAPLLDKDLTNLIARFNEGATWPRTLSLEDQGRFAIGFYYERAPKTDESATDDNPTTDTPASP
jgi:CRISPR-associated protein Csd1